jgi:hypothetical protein
MRLVVADALRALPRAGGSTLDILRKENPPCVYLTAPKMVKLAGAAGLEPAWSISRSCMNSDKIRIIIHDFTRCPF